MPKVALVDGDKLYCCSCQEWKELSLFHKDSSSPRQHAYYCKACANSKSRAYHHKHKTTEHYKYKKRNGWIKEAHGLTLQEYTEKLAAQDFLCAICEVKLLTQGHLTHLDHDHKTGKLRAFLCTNCNRGLGHFQDSPNLLAKAITYLESHSTSVDCVKEDIHL